MSLPVVLALLGLFDMAPPDREAQILEACRAWAVARTADSPVVHRIGEDGLCFRGDTTDANAAAFIEAVAGTGVDEPLVIVVDSGGGEINAAMAMAEAIVPRRTTVIAQRQCMSSCANYLFLAGDRRVVAPGTLLVYHGGIFREPESHWAALRDEWRQRMNAADLEASMAASREYADSSLRRQDAFLRSVNVDPNLFEWMQSLNALTPEERAARCPVPNAPLIVFSDAILAEKGIVIADNRGPQSDEALAEELGTSAGMACYWD